MPSSVLSSKGQVVVPKPVRDLLDLQAGDRIDFVVGEGGEVSLRPVLGEVTDLKGLLAAKVRRPVTLREMDAAVRRRAARRT